MKLRGWIGAGYSRSHPDARNGRRGGPDSDAGSDRLEIAGGRFSVLASDQFVLNLLAFVQAGQAGFFHGRNMHEHVFRAVIGLDKAESFGCIEPFHLSSRHEHLHIEI